MKFVLESQQYGLTTKRKWFKGNKKPERYASTLDQAKYDKNSLERADGQSYVIIDTKTNQLVEDMNIREAKAEIKGNSEHSALSGTIRFKQIGDQVNVIIDLENLPKSKFLGFHIHAKGDCSGNDEDEFKNVGKHYNPSRTQHPEHAGDLTSIYSSNGRIHQEFETDKFTVDEIIGKSVIIHSDRDDFKSQPSGDSGDKIACGVIEALIGDNMKLVKEDLKVWDQEDIDNQNALASIAKELRNILLDNGIYHDQYGEILYDIFDYGNEIHITNVNDMERVEDAIESDLGFPFRIENGYDIVIDTTQEYEDESGDIHTRVSREYLKEDIEISDEPEDISHIIFDNHYGNEFIDEIAVTDRGSIDHYYTLIKNINDAERFNYHSDYWGYDEDYQEQNVELVDKLSPYIGKEVQIDYDDGSITGKLLGIAVDRQYNDIHHTKVILDSIRDNLEESLNEDNQVKKCALCGKEFKGYGNNGQPLVNGRVCDDCNKEVIKARINKSNKLTEKVAVDYINLNNEQKNQLINQVRNFFKRNSRAYVLPSINSDILEFISDLYAIDNQIDLEDRLADEFGITFPKGNLFKILHQFEEPKEEDSDYFDESVNQLKDMADEAKKKQKGLGAFVKLDAGNVEQNVATFNANMTPNIGEDLELSDEEVIEPRTINIKHELRNHDMDNDESFGNLSDMYEFLESELSIDDKKNIISFMLKGDYDSISKLLNDRIDDKLDSELGDLDRYVDKNYR